MVRSVRKGTNNALKLNGGKWISPVRRLAIYLRDGFECAYCGRDLHGADPLEVTLDHLVCRCKGGDHRTENLVTACRSCNSRRGAKVWFRYATGGAVERIKRLRRRKITRYLKLAKALIKDKTGQFDKLKEAR